MPTLHQHFIHRLIQQHFNARLSFNSIKVSASLPDSTKAKLAAGVPVQVPVKVTNTGAVPQTYFTDGRLDQTGSIELGDLNPGEWRDLTPEESTTLRLLR